MAPHKNKLQADIDCLYPLEAALGEGLAYDPVSRRLWCVDIRSSRLFAFELDSAVLRSWQLPVRVTALAMPTSRWAVPSIGEAVLLCVSEIGFCWLGIQGDEVLLECITDPEAHLPGNRFNDGKIGPDGRFYAGTMDDGEISVSGAFYALSPNGTIDCLDRSFGITNGPAFSPDGMIMYENDSMFRKTYAYDLNSEGQIARRRLLHQFSESDGYPDGMTTDQDGNLWIAMWDGAKIQRLDPEGRKTGFLATPVKRPTNCLFTEGQNLVFTSAAYGVASGSPLEGGWFQARLHAG